MKGFRSSLPTVKAILPVDDLQLKGDPPSRIYIPDDVSLSLDYPIVSGPNGARWLQCDSSGNLKTTLGVTSTAPLPVSQYDGSGFLLGASLAHPEITALGGPASAIAQVIASRTDTVSVNLGPFNAGGYYNAVLMLSVTAASGTSPSAAFFYGMKDHLGTFYGVFTGPVLTAVSTGFMRIGIGLTVPLIDPFYIQMNITGTTPSFTWYMDALYH